MGYSGEITMKFKITTDSIPTVYQEGERIGQLVVVPYPQFEPVFVDEIVEGDRGENGYGSSNKKVEEAVTEDGPEFVGEVVTSDITVDELETIKK